MSAKCIPKRDDTLDGCTVPDKFTDMETSLPLALKRYLETLTGQKPELRPVQASGLPLFLRERFSLYSTELFGRPWSLAMEDETWDVGSPAEYEKQAASLRQHLDTPPVLVFSALPSNTRNRLVQRGVPFIVPGNQAFLPSALVDLREHFPRLPGSGRATLSPTAQLTVLYHLHRESLDAIPLRNIAEKLGCSPMMLSKVKDELEDGRICTVERAGRSMTLHFPKDKRAFWDSVNERLTSPVRKTRWVQWHRAPPALLAGVSALSRSTLLADDRLPTYALGPRMLESWLEHGTMTGCADADQANARIQVWSYEPKILGGNESVDPFSLYLSLRSTPDERIQQALEQLMGQLSW